MNKSQSERLTALSGMICAVTALTQLPSGIRSFVSEVTQVPTTVIAFLASVLFLIGLYLLWSSLRRKSRLLCPEVFLIDPDNPEHIKGRDDEVRAICKLVRQPLVFLEGESGVGKSAVLRSKVIPKLENDDDAFVIYINSYGHDWIEGPEANLRNEVWKKLQTPDLQSVRPDSLEDLQIKMWANGDTPGVFAFIKNNFGKTPLLIFDQFDDYQTKHRSRFLRKGQWLSSKQLTGNSKTANPFWSKISEALKNQSIHCLFATSSDNAAAMISIQFVDPEVFHLERLDPTFFIALVEQLVTPTEGQNEVVLNPKNGWESLKQRLARDLSYGGRILPVQARMALRGLIKLPYLSVASYERAGGVAGLESSFIQDCIASAASRSKLDKTTVLGILSQLVEDSGAASPKTCIRSHTELCVIAHAANAQVTSALEFLAQDNIGVVRLRVSTDTGPSSERYWSLYHDYLANALFDTQQKAVYWQELLMQKADEWARVDTISDKWRSLLSCWQWIRILFEKARGHVQLRGQFKYMAWSTLSFLPFLTILVLLAGSWERGLRFQATKDAQAIIVSIRGSQSELPSPEEIRQLWKLTVGSNKLKNAFLHECIYDNSAHDALSQRIPFISQSLYGTSPTYEERRLISHELFSQYSSVIQDVEAKAFFGQWLAYIYTESGSRFKKEASILADLIATSLEHDEEPHSLAAKCSLLRSLSPLLPPKQSSRIIFKLIPIFRSDNNCHSVGAVIASLSKNAAPDDAVQIGEQLLLLLPLTLEWQPF